MILDDAGPPRVTLRFAEGLDAAVLLGLVGAAPVHVGPSGSPQEQESEQLCAQLRRRLDDRAPADIEELRPARALYRALGIDPTKTRPSSEALLRRVLARKPLPRISNAVDLCNLLSLRFLLPMGLYDAAKIEHEVMLRRGEPGETYAGIRKQDVRLEGRLVLADRRGAFGNPTSDSLRASVDSATESLWLVIFAPSSFSTDRLSAHVASARQAMERHLARPGSTLSSGGEVVGRDS